MPLAASAQPTPPSATATRTDTAPVIDGRPTEAVWQQAAPLTHFLQRDPVEGAPVSERTEIRLLFDDEALYVGGWLFDRDPSAIVVGDQRRDASLDQSDALQVLIDTYRDRQNGFVFATNPNGIEYDGQVANEAQTGATGGGLQQSGSGGGFNLNWDGRWSVATSIDERGWYVEMRIPFSTLRYPKSGAQVWGLNISRYIRRRNEQAYWAPVPRQFNLYRVSVAGEVTGIEAPARRVMTATPYVLGDVFRDYRAGTSTQSSASAGIDGKIGLTSSLTLDLTINTDFAQVEVDDQQVNLTRFPLFFPEKRAFFLENAGTFTVGSSRAAELFFPRRIGLVGGREVPMQGGARVTGQVAGLKVGMLAIRTGALDIVDDTGAVTRVADPTTFGVMRASRDFANRTRLGGIVVTRVNNDDTGDHNVTYGVDGTLGIGPAVTFDGWAALTRTPGITRGDYGYNVGGRYQTRDWNVSAAYREVGDGFNPEVGFLARRGYRHVNARAQRNIRFPNVRWFRELRPHVSMTEFRDFSGFTESRLIHIDNHFEFANGAFFQLPGLNLVGEGLREPFEIRPGIVIPAGYYEHWDWGFRYNTNLSAPISIRGNLDAGGFYTGRRIGVGATMTHRLRDRMVTSVRVNYFDVSLKEGAFTTSVAAVDTAYTFTPNVFLQARVQYASDTRNVGANLRFGWIFPGGTGLYVVYNDTEHLGPLERTGLPRGPSQRQLIVKFARTFDLAR